MTKKHYLQQLKSIGKHVNVHLPELINQYHQNNVSRREFMKRASALGLSAAAVYSIAGGAINTAHAAKKGGVFRIGMKLQELKDPQHSEWIESSNVTRGICEYLTYYTDDGVVKGYLAESWKISDEGRTFDLMLRKGIKWSNGDEFNADDVLFNFERWRKLGNESINNSEWGKNVLSGVEKINPYQVRLHLVKPDVSIAHRLFAYPTAIVHRSFEDTGADLTKQSIGTGPFSLEYYRVGEGAKLVRRNGYWGGPDGLGEAYLDAVQIVDLGEDDQASISALVSNQIDWIYKLGPKQRRILETLPHVQLLSLVTSQTPVMRFNVEKVTNAKLREAIVLATDNAEILARGIANDGTIAEHHHTASIQPDYYDLPQKPQQDIARAAKLIAEAGMKDKPIKLRVGNTQGAYEQDIAQVLQQQCKKANINIELDVMPAAAYWESWDTWDFSLTFWAHRPLAVMLHKLAYRSDAKWNETHFKSTRYDEALDAASSALDVKSASQHMKICEEELQNNHVMVQPLWAKLTTGGHKKVRNFPLHQQEYYPFHRIWMET